MTAGGGSDPSDALTLNEALAWIADLLVEPAPNVRPGTLRTDLRGWDSLGQLVLMSALDQRFGIKLTQDELTSLAAVQDILEVLRRHGRLDPA